MFFSLKVWWAKKVFSEKRGEIYNAINAQISDAGGRRVETLPEMFGSWAKRSSEREESIALVYKAIEQRLRSGKMFSSALQGFIPGDEALLINAGEASNRLSDALTSAITSQKATAEMSGAVSGAMFQPMFNFLGWVVSSVCLGKWLWPELMSSFTEEYWPSWALPLIHFDMWLAGNWFLMFLGFIALPLYYYSLENWTGRFRQVIDKIPPYSMYRDKTASGLLVILAGLIKSGLTVDEALKRIASSSMCTPYLLWHVNIMMRRMRKDADNAIKMFQTGLFSQQIIDRLADSLRTRSPDEALSEMGEKSLSDVVAIVKKSAQFANGICMVLLGLLFAYSVAAQMIGAQEAGSNFMSKSMRV
ncbi:hypothetical protein JAB4_059280 (plasmid) [Janthinobacterium sp. HH102]|nr:hypothetical protein JAB4_059280 [Janthinobacterium sp. HH102]